MEIVDYSKIDRDTIEFLIAELKKEIALNPLMLSGLQRAIIILESYWKKSLESKGANSIL